MEEDIEVIINRFLEEAQELSYPSEKLSIRDRYKDVSILIYKKLNADFKGSFLSFGSRRSSVNRSYGNTPIVMRRSLSSNGILEYAVEQFGSLSRRKGNKGMGLPSITMEETEREVLDEHLGALKNKTVSESHLENSNKVVRPIGKYDLYLKNKVKPITPLDDFDYISEIRNRKSFSQYDILPSQKPLNKLKESASILETSFDTISNTGSVIELKLNESPASPVEEVKKFTSNMTYSLASTNATVSLEKQNQLDLTDIPIPKSSLNVKPIELESDICSFIDVRGSTSPPEGTNHDRRSSMNEKNSRHFRRTSVRSSLRDLPRRSPTPPRKSPRKSSKNVKEKGCIKTEFCSLNINGTNYSADCLPFNDELNVKENLLSMQPQPILASHKEKFRSGKKELPVSSLPAVDPLLLSLNDHPFNSIEKESFNTLTQECNKNKNSLFNNPNCNSNSIYVAPVPSNGKMPGKLMSDSPPSFQRAFNRHRSVSHRQQEEVANLKNKKLSDGSRPSEPTYLYSKSQPSQVKLIKFTQSTEDNVPKSSIKRSAQYTNFIVTKAHIRSNPCDTVTLGERDMNLLLYQDLTTTNSSRLCSLM